MAAYLNYLQVTYGALDDAAIANIRPAIHAPFNPSKDIGAELQAFTRNIELLPVALRGKYVDTEKISIVFASLRPEEATKVNAFNQANPSLKVILGGSCVHNSRSFLKEIGEFF
jgi:hypothetical protein